MVTFARQFFASIVVILLFLGVLALAGTITPPGDSPEPTFYTLDDVYNKLTDPDYVYSDHTLIPTDASDETTMRDLETIYGSIPEYQTLDNSTTTQLAGLYATTTLADIEPDLLPENIADGVEMFGITGTLVCTPSS